MAEPRVLIGSGPDALRAAAALAALGQRVLLLQTGPTASGLVDDSVALELPRFALDPSLDELARQVLGPLEACPPPRAGLLTEAGTTALPLSVNFDPRILPMHQRGDALRDFARARLRAGLADLVGGGQEERTHRDWVIRRFGAALWRTVYAPYALARWAAPSGELSSALARHHHVGGPPRVGLRATEPFAAQVARASALIAAAGGEIRVAARPEALIVEGGRIGSVRLSGGETLRPSGPLWLALPPAQIAALIGADLPRPVAVDAGRLSVFGAVRVRVEGALPGDGAPFDVVQVIDPEARIWRLRADSPGHFLVDLTEAPDRPLPSEDEDLMGLVADRLSALGIRGRPVALCRVPGWEPIWRANGAPILRSLLLGWMKLGLSAVGRAGAFAPLDLGQELAVTHRVAASEPADLVELQRVVLPRPVWLDDLRAGMGDFVSR